jgi:pyruvate kinase
MRKTKIVCTLGPAVDNDDIIRAMIQAGMNCARLNFSHGTHEEHEGRIDRIKRIRKEMGVQIALMLDTKGPEIRLGNFADKSANVVAGQEFKLYADERLGTVEGCSITYPLLAENVRVGSQILIDDGKVCIEVIRFENADIVCRVINSGVLSNHKSLNIPGVEISMPYISEKDRDDILFGIEQGVDFIASSFVRTGEDVLELRKLLSENDGKNVQIISKIENAQGIENLDAIMNWSDGIMVARGDMGVEIAFKDLPHVQKDIIRRCYKEGKYVITATQMLESMTKNPRPTRAEVSDVANAIYDGTTAIMLSGESAVGDYPVEAVKVMDEIAITTENDINYGKRFEEGISMRTARHNIANAVCSAACSAAYYVDANAIIAVTRTGRTAKQISDFRPKCPIIAAVVDETACRQLSLGWNVTTIPAGMMKSADDVFEHGIKRALETGIVKSGDTVVIVGSAATGLGQTELIKVQQI